MHQDRAAVTAASPGAPPDDTITPIRGNRRVMQSPQSPQHGRHDLVMTFGGDAPALLQGQPVAGAAFDLQ